MSENIIKALVIGFGMMLALIALFFIMMPHIY